MAIDLSLPLRAVQALFAIIVLGTSGYVAHKYFDSPSENNFLIFTSVWTLLVVAYLILSTTAMPKLGHRFIHLGAEAGTMIFWFAGFIAMAVWVSDHLRGCSGRVCHSARAAVVFAAFEWVLWTVTTILTALKAFRGGSTAKPAAGTGPTVTV
jgi:hypothetical protein